MLFVSASLQRLEGVSRIARSLAAGGGGLYASLLRSHDDFQQITVSWEFCSAHAASRQNPDLSIEDSSKIPSVRFPLVLLPKSRILVAREDALELRN